jgi:hypothetical protein
VRPIFSIGDYETACFAAMKEVDVAVRAAAGLDNSVLGRDSRIRGSALGKWVERWPRGMLLR